MTLHTSFKKGKRICLILRNGSTIITKFIEKRSDYIVTSDGDFLNKKIRSCTIAKQTDTTKEKTR